MGRGRGGRRPLCRKSQLSVGTEIQRKKPQEGRERGEAIIFHDQISPNPEQTLPFPVAAAARPGPSLCAHSLITEKRLCAPNVLYAICLCDNDDVVPHTATKQRDTRLGSVIACTNLSRSLNIYNDGI